LVSGLKGRVRFNRRGEIYRFVTTSVLLIIPLQRDAKEAELMVVCESCSYSLVCRDPVLKSTTFWGTFQDDRYRYDQL